MTDQDKPAFATAMNRLVVALRDKEPDVVQMRVYFEALKDLELDFVVAAADRLNRHAGYFPKTSEWHEMAVTIEHERRTEQLAIIAVRKKAGLPPLCAGCDDTGWAHVENGVKRCDCRSMRRLEVLGRRPMPLMPEHRELTEGESATAVGEAVRELAAKKGIH